MLAKMYIANSESKVPVDNCRTFTTTGAPSYMGLGSDISVPSIPYDCTFMAAVSALKPPSSI